MYDFQGKPAQATAVSEPPAKPRQGRQRPDNAPGPNGWPSISDAPLLACVNCRRLITQGRYLKGPKAGQPANIYCQAGMFLHDIDTAHYCLMSWPKGNGGGDDL